MKQSTAVVTAADAGYFDLLDGLLASLEAAALPMGFSICIFDLGLTQEQREALQARVSAIVSPDWALDFPGRERAPAWFGAMVNRPFLPRIFPGFQTYLWLDSDCWVQEGNCLPELVEAAAGGEMALVLESFGPEEFVYQLPQADGTVRELPISEARIRSNLADCYRRCFGADKAHHAQDAVMNSGVFALRGDSPVWDVWAKYLALGLRGGAVHKLVEQQALNLAYLEGKIAVRPMPTRYNWNMTTRHPTADVANRRLLEPETRLQIDIVHLTDIKGLRTLVLPSLDGRRVKVPLHYRRFKG